MPDNSASAQVANWNQKFSGGDVAELFKAAADAARTLTSLRQFEAGEKPRDWWFPRPEAWAELEAMQKQRDAAVGVSPTLAASSGPATRHDPTLAESIAAFEATDDPVARARAILRHPDFLDMALRQDPQHIKELADLCGQLSLVLSHEADAALEQAPAGALESSIPLTEQKNAAKRRMRI